MNTPLPAHSELFNKIIHDLNEITKKNLVGFVRVRALNELEASALYLKDLDLAHGFSALGSIEAARGNFEKMHRHHRVSLQYGSDPMLTRNYLVSIAKCGSPDEAIQYGERIFAGSTDRLGIADVLARIAYDADDERNFVKFAKKYSDIAHRNHDLWETYLQISSEIKSISRSCAAATARACTRAGV